ncbi:hypothetical protein TREMEDRAFT_66495 [Tremella mesenterica DSM 1558]|uniref:uncharacterized protein n=1 Tax=Tremella mesenterica (strain ATCC 24925 / CBS 8224 / DSM 1558 / NBRC 9311 / NRRL Y-6157 / RJB 2259-6 / UBC 559-6) TaxID=578456 RepID=UPI00032CD15E|nr:uncharacterized protein TREMEDRAFT_66495 [Tremella mesenterica DSM 1558]EIW65503.1 hypothetical protein TREMEDRAFT_66495 [Tremella mesenterica DSM 1558]
MTKINAELTMLDPSHLFNGRLVPVRRCPTPDLMPSDFRTVPISCFSPLALSHRENSLDLCGLGHICIHYLSPRHQTLLITVSDDAVVRHMGFSTAVTCSAACAIPVLF